MRLPARTSDPNPRRRPPRGRRALTDDGPYAVVCLLCGGRYRAIAALHLQRIHGFRGPHPVEDYKRRFDVRVVNCHDLLRLQRRNRVRTLVETGHHWPRARVLAELRRRRRAGRSIAASRLPDALLLSIRRRFGSWDTAVRRLGLEPTVHRLTHRWDPTSIVRAVRAVAGRGLACSAKRARDEHPALFRAVRRWAGRWSEGLRRAGLDPAGHREPRRWSLDIARAWVRSAHRVGRSVRTTAAPPGLVGHVRRATSRSWARFVESVGVAYPGGLKRLDWTDAAVLDAIRARARRGLPLNVRAVVGEGQALRHQARNRFGSWDAAVRAAGLQPQPLRHRWTRAELLVAIRRRRRARRPLARGLAIQDDRRLVRAAERAFGSWGRALAAAGLPRAAARRPAARAR